MNILASLGGQLIALLVSQLAGKAKAVVESAMIDGYALAKTCEAIGLDLLNGKVTLDEATGLALAQFDTLKMIVITSVGEGEVLAEDAINNLQGDFISVITGSFGAIAKLIP